MKVTQKVELLEYTGNATKTVAMAARLCYSSSDIAGLADMQGQDAFVDKLVDMGHLSPIEHASFTFGIEGVSRALLAQITRHRIASFSVQSQRYVGQSSAGGEFNYIIPPAIEELGEECVKKYKAQMKQISGWYDEWSALLGTGEKSNEDARFVLPNACETRMVLTMNARELMHFFSLRCCNRAQWEIRALAWDMLKLAYEVAPGLFKSSGPACVRGSCSEGRMCCKRQDEVRAIQKGIVENGR